MLVSSLRTSVFLGAQLPQEVFISSKSRFASLSCSESSLRYLEKRRHLAIGANSEYQYAQESVTEEKQIKEGHMIMSS